MLCQVLTLDPAEKRQMLETLSAVERAKVLIALLNGYSYKAELDNRIREEARLSMEKNQKDYYLNEQLKAIKHELDLDIDDEDEIAEYKEKLKNLIHELNLDESVDLIPGDKVDVSEKYDEADYMIFPSIYEGFGIVLLEAQAKRIPCFVSEAIQKEVDAGLLNYIKLSETPEKWAEKILLYIDSNNEIDDSKIQKNLNRFNSKEICEQYAKIYGGNE